MSTPSRMAKGTTGARRCGGRVLPQPIYLNPRFDHNHHIDECRLRQYVGLLGSRKGKQNLVGEATPDYLADPVAAMMLGKLLPAAKLIVLTRDPIKRAHAAWDQNRRAGSETRPFKQAVKDEMSTAVRCQKLAKGLASGPATVAQQHAYVETCEMFIDGSPGNCWVNQRYDERPGCKRYLYKGFYGTHLRFWMQNFPASQILVVPSEVYFADEGLVRAEWCRRCEPPPPTTTKPFYTPGTCPSPPVPRPHLGRRWRWRVPAAAAAAQRQRRRRQRRRGGGLARRTRTQ